MDCRVPPFLPRNDRVVVYRSYIGIIAMTECVVIAMA